MKKVVRIGLYLILYGLVLCAFAYLGTRKYTKVTYTNDHERFHEDYKNIDKDNKFEYFNSSELINFLKSGSGVVFLGDKENEWSIKYAELINEVVNNSDLDKIYYYDVRKVKLLQNSNYYAIIKELEGYLIETDDSQNNLFSPSLYIVKDGNIVYHDSTTAVINNEESLDNYWNMKKEYNFKQNIRKAIEEYC